MLVAAISTPLLLTLLFPPHCLLQPEVIAPGFDIMSARSGGDWVYNNGATTGVLSGLTVTNNCVGPTAPATNWTWAPTGVTWVPVTFTVPATELFDIITVGTVNVGLNTPIRLWSVTLTISASTAGWFELWVVSTTENGAFQMAPAPRVPVAACGPGTALPDCPPVVMPIPGAWEMGGMWAGSIQIYAQVRSSPRKMQPCTLGGVA